MKQQSVQHSRPRALAIARDGDVWRAVAVLMVFVLMIFAARAIGQTPEERGLEIAKLVDAADEGFGDNSSEMVMILRNRHGQEDTRKIRNRTLEVKGDGDKTMVIFDTPHDVKGTAFLSFTHKEGDDDQWLYLPALKRVKRISSSNKSGPFMGSEFAYEDIASQEIEKYTYKYIRDEEVGGEPCHVVERYPVDKKSGYTKIVSWIHANHYRLEKAEFYDKRGAHLKTLETKGYQQYKDKFWRADEFHMTNHITGKSTSLVWENYEFQTGLTDRDFDKNSLARAR